MSGHRNVINRLLLIAILIVIACQDSNAPPQPSSVALVSGNGQTGTVGQPVSAPLVVKVATSAGAGVSGVAVSFVVTGGGGHLSGTLITTDALGHAGVVWTLGTTAGSQNNTVTATVSGLLGSPVTFVATAVAGPATSLALSSGNSQTAQVGSAVPVAPSVSVADQFSNPVEGVLVTFSAASGGGTVNPTAPVATNTSGIATVTSWTLGPTAGSNTLAAAATGLSGSPVLFSATGLPAAPAVIAKVSGDGQSAGPGSTLPQPLVVRVRDAFGNSLSGVMVTWAVAGGGGSVTPLSSQTDSAGLASTSFTLGNSPGANTASVTVTGLASATFAATALAQIAFELLSSDQWDIHLMNSDGSEVINLTNNAPWDDRQATWSPDGTRIAFVSDRDDIQNGQYPEIYVMNADGSNQTRVTLNNTADFHPSWSSDGTKIALARRDVVSPAEIYVMNSDGTAPVRLTNNSAEDFQPAWSPDGTRIAFTSQRDGEYEIYVMNADGSGQVRLTNVPGSHEMEPAWSPDGARIAFTSTRDVNTEIYVMNADGTAPINLTSHSASDASPSWSFDGARIAFQTERDGQGNPEIYFMNADGSQPVRVTNTATTEQLPRWRPHGTYTPTP